MLNTTGGQMTDTTKKNLAGEIEQIEQTLQIARQQAKDLERAVQEMEERVRLARGTQDLTEKVAAVATPPAKKPEKPATPPKPQTLRQRIEAQLRRESMSVSQLARTLVAPQTQVTDVVEGLRKEGKLYNVGSAEYPMWTYRIGDHTPTSEVNRLVRRLIAERPMSLRELVDATGARLSRVSGAIVHLQRTEKQMLNLGVRRAARWFLVTDKAQVTRLPPKGKPIEA